MISQAQRHLCPLIMRIFLLYVCTGLSQAGTPPNSCSVPAVFPGVTIVTHGYQFTRLASMPEWVHEMARAIAVRQGGGIAGRVPIYTVRITDDSGTLRVDSVQCDNCGIEAQGLDLRASGTAVIKVDWADVACGDPLTCPSSTPTWEVADALFTYLMTTGIQGINVAQLPLHLIGHSRGGSVMSRLAYDFGTRGIWVQQVTTLDPQPVTTLFGDFDVKTWENVLFADNYYRRTNPSTLPIGQPVAGTYETRLDGIVTGEGYDCNGGIFGNGTAHEQVHSYYHGTIFGDDACDGHVLIQPEWYEPRFPGRRTGFYFSRIGGGSRLFGDALAGLHWELGQTERDKNREDVTQRQPNNWPNAMSLHRGGETYLAGESVVVPFFFQDNDSTLDVEFSLDNDSNPFNNEGNTCYRRIGSNEGLVSADHISIDSLRWTPSNEDAGTWYLQIKARERGESGRVRYDYLPKPINILAVAQPKSNLIIENLAVANQALEPGARVTVTFAIRNVGSGPALPSSANVRINSSSSTVVPADLALVTDIEVPRIEPGESFAFAQTLTLPRLGTSGAYYVWAIIDVNNEANQFDVSDASDKATVGITVDVPPAPSAIGDYVQVYATSTAGLRMRTPEACDPPVFGGNHFDGAKGRIIDGPEECTIEGVIYTFWKIRWSDCGIGWSADKWLKKIDPITVACDGPVLSATAMSITVQADAGSRTFVLANAGTGSLTWSATSSAGWIEIQNQTGNTLPSGSQGGLTFSFSANVDSTPRIAAIVVTAGGAQGSPLTLTVNQAANAPGNVITWTGAADGNWFNRTNWSPQVVPTGSDKVIINQGSVSVPGTASFATLNLIGGQLSGSFTNMGTFSWTGGTLQAQVFNAQGGVLVFDGAGDKVFSNRGAGLVNEGLMRWSGTGKLLVAGDSFYGHVPVENRVGATWEILANSETASAGGNYPPSFGIVNNGLIRKIGQDSITTFGQCSIQNNGTVEVQQGKVVWRSPASLANTSKMIFGVADKGSFGSLVFEGAALLRGSMIVQFKDGFVPSDGNVIVPVQYRSREGSFSTIDSNRERDLDLLANYTSAELQLTVRRRVIVPSTLSLPSIDGDLFTFNVGATSGATYVIEVSTNLSRWTPLQTNNASSNIRIESQTLSPMLFFRAVER